MSTKVAAVKNPSQYMSTAEQTEYIPTGDKMLTRRRVNIAIEFIDNDVGRRIAILYQS